MKVRVWIPLLLLVIALLAAGPRRVPADGRNIELPPMLLSADRSAGLIEAARATAPGSQRAALSDGEVTEPEYEAAKGRFRECVQAGLADLLSSGDKATSWTIEVVDNGYTQDRFWLDYSVRIGTKKHGSGLEVTETEANELLEAGGRIDRTCHDQHVGSVERVYQVGLLGSEAFIKQIDLEFTACLRSAGYRFPGNSSRDAIDFLITGSSQSELLTAPGFKDCTGDFPSTLATFGG